MTVRARALARRIVWVGLVAGAWLVGPASAEVTLSWNDPGWAYEFGGNAANAGSGGIGALDGWWDHRGGDSWDGSEIGGEYGPTNSPGGISLLMEPDGERTTTFIRFQDPGDPRDYTYDGVTAFPDECNRRLRLTHDMTNEGATDSTLNDGVTITFRARVATLATGPLDPQFPDTASNGEPGTYGAEWPAEGNGSKIADNGRGMFTVRCGSSSSTNRNISFALALPGDHGLAGVGPALVMNNLNGTAASSNVDTGEAGTPQYIEIADLTAWHEFWITILADTSGGGTHRVEVYMDGAASPTVLHVTAGNAGTEWSGLVDVLAMGPSITAQMTAVDVDFVAWKAGVNAPQPLTTCAFRVTPAEEQGFETDINQQPSPASVDYQVANIKPETLTYNVVELDANQVEADVPWLTLSKTSGSVAQSTYDTVTATVDATGLADGYYTAYLRFTNSCNPTGVEVRQINLDVVGCRWTVDGCNATRGYLQDHPEAPIGNVTYTLTNQQATPVAYAVSVAYDDAEVTGWLTLTGAEGTVLSGDASEIMAQIDATKFAAAATDRAYDATLVFAAPCSRQEITRTIRVRPVVAGATRVWKYDGQVNPMAANSAGAGLSFGLVAESPISSLQGESARDLAAHDHVAWHLVDATDAKTKLVGTYYDGAEWVTPTFYNEVGATVVGRLRVSTVDTRELMLGIYDDTSLSCSLHWSGADGILRETRRGREVALAGTSDYIVARMTAVGLTTAGYECARLIRVYFNEDPTPVIEIMEPSSSTNSLEGIGFGAGSTGGIADIWFDWVSGTNAGAFAPGQEVAVIGQSLIPAGTCPDPFADADGDHDVDMADFGVWQACFAGSQGTTMDPARCDCLDVNRDDHIDQSDLTAFLECFSGPGVPAEIGCDDQ